MMDRRADRELVRALERHRPLQRWQLPADNLEREIMRCALDRYRERALDEIESDRAGADLIEDSA
jgi:hypothetical protein